MTPVPVAVVRNIKNAVETKYESIIENYEIYSIDEV